MQREIMILLLIIGVLGACSGCSQVEKQADYGNMTGSIPQDSWLGSLGSGKNQSW